MILFNLVEVPLKWSDRLGRIFAKVLPAQQPVVDLSCLVHADFPVRDTIAFASRTTFYELPISNHEIPCANPLRIPLSSGRDDPEPSDFGHKFLVQVGHLLGVRFGSMLSHGFGCFGQFLWLFGGRKTSYEAQELSIGRLHELRLRQALGHGHVRTAQCTTGRPFPFRNRIPSVSPPSRKGTHPRFDRGTAK